MTPWMWLLFALALLFVEFYLPSGVLATVAGVLFIFSLVDAFMVYGALGGCLFLLLALCGGAAVIKLALFVIRSSSSKNTFFLSSNQEGFVGADADASFVGKAGVATSDLGPSGFALIEKKRLQVLSEGRYIERGSHVRVVGSRGAYLVVKLIPEVRD